MPILSIILVNYNNSTHTIKCLKQLNIQTFKNFEVIVVDNNSNEREIRKLKSFIKNFQSQKQFDLKVLFQGINNGYAGGINYGIKRSLGKYILISNSDIIFNRYFLKKAIHYLNTNLTYDMMGPKIYYYPNSEKIYFTGGYFRFHKSRGIDSVGQGEIDPNNNKFLKPLEVDYISGCSMFVRRDVFKRVKLFDKNFFMYVEDSDFCYRARKLGFRAIYNPEIILYHKIGEERERFSEFIKFNYLKNKFLFILKHYPFILILYHLIISFFLIPISIFRNRTRNKNIIRVFVRSIKIIIEGITLGFKLKIS